MEGRLSAALTQRWKLTSSLDIVHSDLPYAGVQAHAAIFLLTLHYDAQPLEAHH